MILLGFRCAIKLGCVILLGLRCAINLGCVIIDWFRLSCYCNAGFGCAITLGRAILLGFRCAINRDPTVLRSYPTFLRHDRLLGNWTLNFPARLTKNDLINVHNRLYLACADLISDDFLDRVRMDPFKP